MGEELKLAATPVGLAITWNRLAADLSEAGRRSPVADPDVD